MVVLVTKVPVELAGRLIHSLGGIVMSRFFSYLFLLFFSLILNISFAAKFEAAREIKSEVLRNIYVSVQILQESSPSESLEYTKTTAGYSVRINPNQSEEKMVRQFIRYLNNWDIECMEVFLKSQPTVTHIESGIYDVLNADDDISDDEEVEAFLEQVHSAWNDKVEPLLSENPHLKFYTFWLRGEVNDTHADGFLIYDSKTHELMHASLWLINE